MTWGSGFLPSSAHRGILGTRIHPSSRMSTLVNPAQYASFGENGLGLRRTILPMPSVRSMGPGLVGRMMRGGLRYIPYVGAAVGAASLGYSVFKGFRRRAQRRKARKAAAAMPVAGPVTDGAPAARPLNGLMWEIGNRNGKRPFQA